MQKDMTRESLINFAKNTESLLLQVLKKHDKNATCQITPSIDIGFPHDVDRIAGGFPTGIFVEWRCNFPFVPVDTTVNTCTSSIYKLSKNISSLLKKEIVEAQIQKIDSSSYSINFHRGNHFFGFYKSNDSDSEYLIIHTSAAEFKRQFNGLYPVKGNWFMDSVQTYENGDRYIRYITGSKAQLFCKIAKHLITFNEVRHDFFTEVLLNSFTSIDEVSHYHHYCMPTESSILIGSFLLKPGKVAPILSRPGKPIFLYKVGEKSHKMYEIDGEAHLLLPHGWGKESVKKPDIYIDLKAKRFSLNNYDYEIDGKSSLRDHPDLRLRDYKFNAETGYEVFQKQLKDFCEGDVLEYLFPLISYNKNGLLYWKS